MRTAINCGTRILAGATAIFYFQSLKIITGILLQAGDQDLTSAETKPSRFGEDMISGSLKLTKTETASVISAWGEPAMRMSLEMFLLQKMEDIFLQELLIHLSGATNPKATLE